MSSFDPTQVFLTPGRLVVNPTNLSSAPNYGGTTIGYFENFNQITSEESVDVLSEAEGKRKAVIVGITLLGAEFDLVQFDRDMLGKLLDQNGTTLRDPRLGGTVAPGLRPAGQPVLFVPNDVLLHPAFLFFNPSYRRGVSRAPHGLQDKRRERIVIDANDDANGNTYACDLLSALSLT